MQQIRGLFRAARSKQSDVSAEALPGYEQALATATDELPPPTYKRLSELYISTHLTLRELGLIYREQKNQQPIFYLDIQRSTRKLTMDLKEGTVKNGTVVASMSREKTQLVTFDVAGGGGKVVMEERMIGFWCFDLAIVESAASLAAPEESDVKGEQTIATTPAAEASPKTTFAWKVLTPPATGSATKARTQATFGSPDIQLMNWQTGEVHAVYVTDLKAELVGKSEGRLQFRRSFGQRWERLVLISLGSLIEKERYRRKNRGTFAQGEFVQSAGGM